MPNIQIPEVFEFLLEPKRYKILYGGRGGAKSWQVARVLLVLASQNPLRILCTREFQQSVQESVHKLLSDQIEALGLNDFYVIQQKNIKGINGSEFIFEGLRNNVTKIKSMEGVNICWVEEGESVPQNSWDVLIPTIRTPNSEIWVTFNPNDELDDTYQRFVVNPPEQSIVKKVGWQDNPWFPEELRLEMEECKRINPKKWRHIWEGECASDYGDSIIQPEWVEAAIDADKTLGFEGMGKRVLGFDPADEGSDAKAVAYRHGSVIQDVIQWHNLDLPQSIGKCFDYGFDNRVDDIVYDSIGIGAAVKVGLEERIAGRDITVTGFCGSSVPDNKNDDYDGSVKNKDMFKNKRAQYWWLLRDRFEKTYRAVNGEYINPDELISIPSTMEDLTVLKSELSRVQRKRGSNSLIMLESKPEMLKRGVKSPNMADALVMCFANPAHNVKDFKFKPQKRKF